MKTRPFLRDVDDPSLFASMLESCHLLLYEELSEILARFPLLAGSEICDDWFRDARRMVGVYEDLALMRHRMSMMTREMADRKRRLADEAVGLADLELDE